MGKAKAPHKGQKWTSRLQRSGRFTYLKVVLDARAMAALYDLAIQIPARLGHLVPQNNDNEHEMGRSSSYQTDEKPEKKPHTQRPATFRPRSLESLHMTLFFGGEVIPTMPAEELIEWHTQVSRRLAQSSFCLKGNSTETSHDDYFFRFSGLQIFPPHRQNLIVAVFEPSMAWHTLYHELNEIASDVSIFPSLAKVATKNRDRWVAHVTLGNLYGDRTALNSSFLHEIYDPTLLSPTNKNILNLPTKASGITIGGPMPEQVSLDWDFQYKVLTLEEIIPIDSSKR